MDYIIRDGKQTIVIEQLQRDMKQQIADLYRKSRIAKNLTQAELAEKSGIARPNISRFESGNYNPSLEMLVKLAYAMELELEVKLAKNA